MRTHQNLNEKHHSNGTKGMMSGAILATTGLFFALHTLLPEQKLWPAFLIVLGVATMLVSHFKKSRIKSV